MRGPERPQVHRHGEGHREREQDQVGNAPRGGAGRVSTPALGPLLHFLHSARRLRKVQGRRRRNGSKSGSFTLPTIGATYFLDAYNSTAGTDNDTDLFDL